MKNQINTKGKVLKPTTYWNNSKTDKNVWMAYYQEFNLIKNNK